MLDKNFIKNNIAGISQLLIELEKFRGYTIQEAVSDYRIYSSLRYTYMELVERAADINSHLIKESGAIDTEVPDEYRESFLILAKIKMIPMKLAMKLAESAGMRSIIVHEYADVDDKILYNTIGEALDQYQNYCEYILKFIKK